MNEKNSNKKAVKMESYMNCTIDNDVITDISNIIHKISAFIELDLINLI